MTTIEPLAPLPDEPLLVATLLTARPFVPYDRTTTPMPMVRVNLLPAEVTAARRGHRTRRRVVALLVALVVVLACTSLFVRSGIGGANGELAAAEAVNSNLKAQQNTYGAVVTAQSDLADAVGRLGTLTATDVAWADVTRAIRGALPAGVTIAGVDGTGASNSGTAGSAGGASGGTGTTAAAAAVPGTVVLAGYAGDPTAVAAYADALSKSPALAHVAVTGVIALATGGFGFGITADVTAAVVSKRYAPTGSG